MSVPLKVRSKSGRSGGKGKRRAEGRAMAQEKTVGLLFLVARRVVVDVLSFLVFFLLDLLDTILCYLFKVVDFFVENEWTPCYCSSGSDAIISSGNIMVSEQGRMKIVCISADKLQLEDISDTLYSRPSIFSEISGWTAARVRQIKGMEEAGRSNKAPSRDRRRNGMLRSRYRINSTIVEMLQGKIGRQMDRLLPRWSDCYCSKCTSWVTSPKQSLYVRANGLKEPKEKEVTDVLFIHGFVSSSVFWTETLFPNFSDDAKSRYRFLAIDLLGFGRSPKPADSLYTLSEHVDMIERSVLNPYNVKSFHIVAHSLGCIIAIALAVRHPNSVKSLTLLSPPYFPVPEGENGSQYVLRQVAPRRVWPLMAFGSSVAAWYEHISRIWCLVVCKNHRLLDFLVRLITRNRIRTYLVEGFFCHTHHGAWHTLHNIICGTASKMDDYLEQVARLSCQVTVLHGADDELLPVDCSFAVRSKIPRARVKVIEKKDHLTIVVGRQKAFARELEEIWKPCS
ncbi:probable lysophospholipase BODYGUARD 1 [Nymphaea colorata]|nr:probable lysophospholipase BODYGUARD 1 [Nymphaea colorata]